MVELDEEAGLRYEREEDVCGSIIICFYIY